MFVEHRSRFPRMLLVVTSVLVVLTAVQALMFVSTAQPIEKPRFCVVGIDGEVVGCPLMVNPCGGYCTPVGCSGSGCIYQCTCSIE